MEVVNGPAHPAASVPVSLPLATGQDQTTHMEVVADPADNNAFTEDLKSLLPIFEFHAKPKADMRERNMQTSCQSQIKRYLSNNLATVADFLENKSQNNTRHLKMHIQTKC